MKLNITDEEGIELLHFIFERELKPPFREGEKNKSGNYSYLNRDDDYIGWLDSDKEFSVRAPFWYNIEDKVRQVFDLDLSQNSNSWLYIIKPYLKSWLEDQINAEVKYVGYRYGS